MSSKHCSDIINVSVVARIIGIHPTTYCSDSINVSVNENGLGHGEVIRRFVDENGEPRTAVSRFIGSCCWRSDIKPAPTPAFHAQWRANIRQRLERQRALSEALRA